MVITFGIFDTSWKVCFTTTYVYGIKNMQLVNLHTQIDKGDPWMWGFCTK